MSLVPLLKPGVTIYRSGNFARGTFTCFVRKPEVRSALYGVTGKHVLPQGETCILCDNDPETGKIDQLNIGDNPTHIPNMDFTYFEIYAGIRQQLTANNFIPRGCDVEPLQVWDSSKIVEKVEKAPSADRATELQLKIMPVKFVGATQASTGNVVTHGGLQKYSPDGVANINETSVAAGDSGGCVLDATGLRYAGLISRGNGGERSAKSGIVLLLHKPLMQAGLVLATWADRPHWL